MGKKKRGRERGGGGGAGASSAETPVARLVALASETVRTLRQITLEVPGVRSAGDLERVLFSGTRKLHVGVAVVAAVVLLALAFSE